MNKIVTTEQAVIIANKLHKNGKTIVLAGGCFDLLHVGHLTFLENAKAAGNSLFIFLESDASIKKKKGENRPINNQADRAKILAAFQVVDYVILLPENLNDKDYDDMIMKLKPSVIATTAGDLHKNHKERQAAKVGCRVIEVTQVVKDKSTSRMIKLLENEL